MSNAEFQVEKSILLNDLLTLWDWAWKLEEERPTIEKKNALKQYILRFWIVALDCESNVVEWEFEKLIKYSNKKKFFDPALYFAKLVFGIIFTIILFLWVLSMVLCEIISPNSMTCKIDFIGQSILAPLSNHGLGFLSTFLYLILILTLLYGTYLGNRKLGLWFYSCTFYPLVENETLLNGILYNLIFLNFATMAII